MELVQVKFKKRFDSFNSGEVAGYTQERAAELVQAGVAELVAAGTESSVDVAPPAVETLASSAAEFKAPRGRR